MAIGTSSQCRSPAHSSTILQESIDEKGSGEASTQFLHTDHHNHTFPAGVELLTGDGIFSFGYELLARPSENHHPNHKSERILRVIMEITRAMGAQGMVEGQYLQLRRSGSLSDDGFMVGKLGKVGRAIEKMEGGLYACGAACGAILGGATKEETERLRSFGRYAGIIHGIMTSVANDDEHEEEEGLSEMVEKLRSLALKELECFDHQPMVEIISSILHLDSLLQFTKKQAQSIS
ncbi:heterodimeric geranylgeranyl pyrophosphate synthase small subunit, chloroplastic-like [Macadamia integrifolia]|uniref:heterodimeric geranylgeranyl pyrophosphate synthase small subunit, chloroplastic-like n=1 Tax=Macadamia integrifolia TaxID=60698 RepID=UPI001C530927|nr:heterodimeric geranylgeranyl pyrophosphate synthase small subunit, chloroplastic-like [Macadamia integrifolia]